MIGAASNPARNRGGARFAMAGGLLVLALAAVLGVLSVAQASRPARPNGKAERLRDVLSRTIETRGIEAAVAQYRTLRGQGFPGLRESESDTNGLGYGLLRKGDAESAIQVFRLNVETHPESANVHDSLGEAYVAAGDTALAIESYRKAVAIDPRKKSAAYELERLTGAPRAPYPPLVLLHIGAGTLGLLSGAAAMSLRKGSRRHGTAGRVFVAAMLTMSASGAYRAFAAPDGETINVLMGLLTFYLVLTAWLTARRRNGGTGLPDRGALLIALAVSAGLWLEAAKGGPFAGVSLVFGSVALLAAVSDLRMIARGGVSGAGRTVRHLWRMCTALFIAVSSLFLGQPQVFPYALRSSGVLAVPSLLVVALLVFWLIRVRVTKAYERAASPTPGLVQMQVPS